MVRKTFLITIINFIRFRKGTYFSKSIALKVTRRIVKLFAKNWLNSNRLLPTQVNTTAHRKESIVLYHFLKPQVNVYRLYKFYIHSIADHICKFSRFDYMCKHLFTRWAPLGCRLKSSPTSMVVPYFKIISLSCEVLFYMYIMDHTIYMRKRLPLWLFWKQHYTQYHNGCGFIYNKKRLTIKKSKG